MDERAAVRAPAPNAAPSAPEGAADSTAPLRVGISACLLGQKVRWNAGHERDSFLVETVGRFVE